MTQEELNKIVSDFMKYLGRDDAELSSNWAADVTSHDDAEESE